MSLQAMSQYDETIDTLDKYLNNFGKSISQETLDDMLHTRNRIQRDIDEYPQMRGDARKFYEGEVSLYDKIISELKKKLSDKTNVSSIASALTANDLGRSFEVTETKEDTDGDGDSDVDKVKIEKKE